jgi:hypothetical protein
MGAARPKGAVPRSMSPSCTPPSTTTVFAAGSTTTPVRRTMQLACAMGNQHQAFGIALCNPKAKCISNLIYRQYTVICHALVSCLATEGQQCEFRTNDMFTLVRLFSLSLCICTTYVAAGSEFSFRAENSLGLSVAQFRLSSHTLWAELGRHQGLRVAASDVQRWDARSSYGLKPICSVCAQTPL